MRHPNEDTILGLYEAFATADMPTVDRLIADDGPGTRLGRPNTRVSDAARRSSTPRWDDWRS
jgi:hypothetical protein